MIKIPAKFRRWLFARAMCLTRRPADFVIGDGYLYRWWVIPRNKIFNIYLHGIVRDDDDRALHDHPWWNVSLILSGSYIEHMPGSRSRRLRAGDVVFRRARALHLLSIPDGVEIVWSLFVTGPKLRTWGFACPQGWRPWYEFVDPNNIGMPGRGCGE